jgi:transcriptional regulator with XRE-family HTH domain
VLVEPLSARVFRLRIALGYSVYELAEASGIFADTIKRLESGEPIDKRELPRLAAALGVPLCRLLCGDHDCAERACVPTPSAAAPL